MKYHNRQKRFRLAEWAVARPPDIFKVQAAKKWCQQYPSTGRFYFHYTNTRWWFEDKDDALVFTLMWSGNIK